jgi:glutamate synthase domain-containing protein 2
MIFLSPCLQDAAKNNSQAAFKKFSESAWNSAMKCSLRGQLEVTGGVGPIDVSEVEPAKEIVKRFCTGND